MGFMVLALATANLVSWQRPTPQLMVLCFVTGGLLTIVNDLVYLGQLNYWRREGWEADPPGPMVAAGRASEAVTATTTYVEAGSYVVLAAAVVALARLCFTAPSLPTWLGYVALGEAVAMLALTVGISLENDLLFDLGGLLTGLILGPLLALSLGRHVAGPRIVV